MQRALKKIKQSKSQPHQEGFILIELAVVFLILGLLLAAVLPIYETYKHRNSKAETQKRMEIISKAFSSYAQTRWRIPCPADASVAAGSPIGVERASCAATSEEAHGIIPYKTLGISERYAKDGYGNFFTYVVSPDFTVDNRLGVQLDRVNSRLANRVAGNNTNGKFALLPRAQFCAPLNDTGTDIIVQQDGTNLYSGTPRVTTNVNRSLTGTPNTNINRENVVTGLAMAIISHGENKNGAYLSNGNQSPPNPDNTSAEAITSSNLNRTVVTESVYSTIGATREYDDIVNFFTQDEIFALSGRQSCENL